MNEPLEKLIRETLQAEKPPELSSFFASRVVNQIRLQKKNNRLTNLILFASWCIGSFFVYSILTNFVWSNWMMLIFLILVPLSFLLTLFQNASD